MPRALVTGAAGFLGSHLCERLLAEGWVLLGVDSLLTGNKDNLTGLLDRDGFEFEERNVSELEDDDALLAGSFDWILHLASPASPVDYLEFPLDTLRVGSLGTLRLLEAARSQGASFFLASTSEVYGDPLVHPQPESYWGNVNPIGPRSVYDEAKRFAEAATMAYHRQHGVSVRIVRIFNTYGPRMRRRDGRAVPNFIEQALRGEPLTVHGSGTQTRSLCYVEDLIEGIYRLIISDHTGPMNVGNPEEIAIGELATMIRDLAGSSSEVTFIDRPVDDPEMRRPDIALARGVLGWEPSVPLREGLTRTLDWARTAWRSADGDA